MVNEKVAVVTGAARGIGNAIAYQLAVDGYAVVMVDILEETQVKANIDRVKSAGNQVIYVVGNIASAASRKASVDIIMSEFGRIDVLVNNAGVAPRIRKDILETTEESFDFVMGINLKGTFFLTQMIANIMVNEVKTMNGFAPKIINISSNSAYTYSASRGEYCISKAGVSMITALFADRLAEFGICVYEIRPGIIATEMTRTVKDKYDKLINDGLTPIKRWGYPEDVANAVSLFCSDKLSYSTGEIINVDGGFHIRRL